MIVFFYIIVLWALLGWVIGNTYLGRKLFSQRLPKNQYYSFDTTPRYFIPITVAEAETVFVKTRVLPNRAKELAKDIEIVTNGNTLAEYWQGYSFQEIVQAMTPGMKKAVLDLRSFLK